MKLIGAIAGDVIGSVYEWHNVGSIDDIDFFKEGCKFTDDTVLTCALANWLMESQKVPENGDKYCHKTLIKNLKAYARRHPYAGYGGMFKKWYQEDFPAPANSYGNGAGMRTSSVAYFCDSLEEVKEYAKAGAEVSHNHPEGIKGAQAISCAIYLASKGRDKSEIKKYIEEEFGYNLNRKLTDIVTFEGNDWQGKIIKREHKFDATCQVTVPEALIAFLEGDSYDDVIVKALLIGGDSDTIACMAGAIAGAYYGVPEYIEREVMACLSPDLAKTVVDFENLINKKRYINNE